MNNIYSVKNRIVMKMKIYIEKLSKNQNDY